MIRSLSLTCISLFSSEQKYLITVTKREKFRMEEVKQNWRQFPTQRKLPSLSVRKSACTFLRGVQACIIVNEQKAFAVRGIISVELRRCLLVIMLLAATRIPAITSNIMTKIYVLSGKIM